MKDFQGMDALSIYDAFWLYLEHPGLPMNVAAVCEFEGEIALDECTRYIESKLPQLPRFTQRLEPDPLRLTAPVWRPDPHFDIRNHVRQVRLQTGSAADWKSTMGGVLGSNLDSNRPLWDITLAQGLQPNKTGLVFRVHHSVVDGVAGVGLMKALLQETPYYEPVRSAGRAIPQQPAPRATLIESVVNASFVPGRTLLNAQSELLRLAGKAFSPDRAGNGTNGGNGRQANGSSRGGLGPILDIASVLTEAALPVQKLPFNTLCGGSIAFDWFDMPFEDIRGIKQNCAATVNDVVLAILCGALRRYTELHGWNVSGRSVRIGIPVNVRNQGEEAGAGNHITMISLTVPVAVGDPLELLRLVQRKMAVSRNGRSAELIALTALMVGTVPTPLQMLGGAVLRRLPISLANTVCTNVPGPEQPLYLIGHKLLAAYPFVPIGGELGMNCAVLTYNGTMHAGFTGDAHAIPDLADMANCFRESFEALRSAAGVRTHKHPRVRKARDRKQPAQKVAELKHPVEETRARNPRVRRIA
jgi:WS/DGAT/MGAT family acyltransferase